MEERTCTLGRGFTNEVMLPNIPKATILKLSLAIHQTGIKYWRITTNVLFINVTKKMFILFCI